MATNVLFPHPVRATLYGMDVNQPLTQTQEPQKPQWHPSKAQKVIAIVGGVIILVLLVSYAYISYLAKKNYDQVAMEAEKAQQGQKVIYKNSQYGFSIDLSSDWRGYSILNDQWEGWNVFTAETIEHGPKIILRSPKWSDQDQYEDMPIMIFTVDQWSLVENETLAVSAAPIPPSVLGLNSKYIIALPARYNYDFKQGWEEVDQLVHTLRTFEPSGTP